MTDKNTSNAAVASIVGAGIGAVAGAAAVFLSDEKNRKQLHEKANTLKTKATEAVKTFKDTASNKVDEIKDVTSGDAEEKKIKKQTV